MACGCPSVVENSPCSIISRPLPCVKPTQYSRPGTTNKGLEKYEKKEATISKHLKFSLSDLPLPHLALFMYLK